MTLHISEIGVTMAVAGGGSTPPEPGNGGGASGGSDSCCEAKLSDAQREAIVEEAVQRVLAQLRMAESR